jgi:cytochrome c-type biogenesis protein CcmE
MALTRRQRRLSVIGIGALLLALAAGLVLVAFNDSIVFFRTPTDVVAGKVKANTPIRLGGLVKPGSYKRKGTRAEFEVTDVKNTVKVIYIGILPDLFREGQGVVAEGRIDDKGVFQAAKVLAKHDENYMPKEVADALKKTGHWKPKAKDQGGGQDKK